VLLVAFGVYCLMGLIFFITGIVYMGDAGTVGATGIYLMALGFIMLIVGGIAIWANNSSKWMILFVIELINIALFLVRVPATTSQAVRSDLTFSRVCAVPLLLHRHRSADGLGHHRPRHRRD
jgi:hypothetical protein